MDAVNFNTHSFSPYLAKSLGLKDAIWLQHIYHWLKHNRGKGSNFYDGNWWTYNTRKGFSEYFEYLTEDDIRGIVERLEKKEIITTGNYNKIPYDKTKWYALTKKGWQLLNDTIGEFPQSSGESTKSSGFITKSKAGNSPTYTNSKTSLTQFSLSEMENFAREREFKIDVKKFYDWCINEGTLKGNWKNIMVKWAAKPENKIKIIISDKEGLRRKYLRGAILKAINVTADYESYFKWANIENNTIFVTDKRALQYKKNLDKIGIKIELK